MQEIRVAVPDDRVAEFYKWFGSWLEGSASEAPNSRNVAMGERMHWSKAAEHQQLAAELWGKLSGRGQALFSHLIDQPGSKFTGEDLAASLDIPNGRYGVAGVLAWPGRYCSAWNLWLPISWSEEEGAYWMEPDVAEMFKEIRSRAQDGGRTP